MTVRSATIYYGRGQHETLFAEADDAAEAENRLTAKIENLVERLIIALHVSVGAAIGCVCALMAWAAHFDNSGNRFLAVFALMLVFMLSAPVVTMTRRASAWSHERIARHKLAEQMQSVALRPDWTWK